MKKVTEFSQSVLSLIIAVGLAGLPGCETNPYTGRSQLLMTSVDQEMQMGARAYSQVKNDPKVHQSQDPREVEPVRRVAARIIEAAKRSKYAEMASQFQWEVTVIKDDKTMSEADYIGILLAADAGYDPRESVHLWERMEQMSSGKGPAEFLSTHPGHETRIEQLKKWMPEAMAIYQNKQAVLAVELPALR
jgi:predicted Zn-dependent protease